MQVLNLFPTDIYVEENTEIDNKKISKIILEKEKIEPSRNITNRGGWQSNDDLHKDKRFSEILESISKYFQLIRKNYSYVDGLEVVVINMWANVNRYKDYNIAHIHPGTDWSFVYYVKTPKDSGNLTFLDPRIRRDKVQNVGLIKNYNNPFIHDIYFVEPAEGKFVIFPFYLEHFVEPNLTKESRISISGNVEIRNKI